MNPERKEVTPRGQEGQEGLLTQQRRRGQQDGNLVHAPATVRILHGDCREVLRTLPEESVHCVVTSPPYWGLRDYGLPPTVWGGDPDCAHEWGEDLHVRRSGAQGDSAHLDGRAIVQARDHLQSINTGGFCVHCGAWRGQLGLEPTPQLYVEHIVEVFREVRRVLRSDGTLWLNLGDCYATGAGKVGEHPGGGEQGARWAGKRAIRDGSHADKHTAMAALGPMTQPNRLPIPGLKPKDLVGIPWRVAFALQADGWYLRSDIIWHKPNPMPESVTDRPTKAHEYLFLLSKSASYYYDAKTIAEPATHAGRVVEYDGTQKNSVAVLDPRMRTRIASNRTVGDTRNRRSVWTVATKPYREAHFATFPPELIEPCILAGSPIGGVVLDPFAGSGTVGEVCSRFGRNAVLIDLNPQYVKLARRRVADAPLSLFAPPPGGN